MHPGIFFGLALFLGIFWFSGSAANMFIMYVIGLTGMGVFTILTGLTVSRISGWINKSFETDKNYPTNIVKGMALLMGIGMLVLSINYRQDVPLYQKQ